jgi:Zn-dependent protease
VTALTIHEFAHAWAGYRLGDDTARRQGRLTLDPEAHIDPFGFLIIVVAVLFNLPLIGWARPVPFNPRNLSNPRRDSILIAIAGPISNVLQAICWLITLWLFCTIGSHLGLHFKIEEVIKILQRDPNLASIPQIIATMMVTGVLVNIGMAVFNMIPLPPLDGHYVLEGLGPPFITDLYNAIRPISFLILLVLIQLPAFDQLFDPFERAALHAILLAFGYPV